MVFSFLFWLALLASGVALVMGLGSGSAESVMVAGGAILVTASLLMLWNSRRDGTDRMRSRVTGVALLMWGIANLLPYERLRLVTSVAAAILVWAALLRIPRRIFPKPSTP